ncbi:Predicted dithiol-disulfide isomerase, DsbA family [Pseudomonas flavescens]|uniref:Predicted dithiol-disulfide isomerase, DsbA family n=1 Tax=Phytopseudomonas flavescens TaxID=29435 RepID=A0A1G7YVC6_9GAMM|nr:DsbA family oxidoreductase [Pseudomonas flavescens]SDG99780.1 Predicted dithiol-disulfide isomerase, DsbA family [Pseudomonas flavescens]
MTENVASDGKLLIEAWSDVVCPWCWIGWTRLNKALDAFGHTGQITVVPRAYRLMPGMRPTPIAEIIAAKTRLPVSEVPAMLHQVETVAATEGLAYDLAGTLAGDTIDAHRLIQFAQEQGRGHALLERLYRAYLSEHTSVFDHDSLLSIAVDAGLEREEARKVLGSDAVMARVEEDQLALQALGGSGVPFFRIGGRYLISGAQPQEVFAKALQQAWDERPVVVVQGAVCGPDGCALPS